MLYMYKWYILFLYKMIHDSMGYVKELEAVCGRRLWWDLIVMVNMPWEGQLLPLKFDDWFFNQICLSFNKQTAPLGATDKIKVITTWTNLLETMQNSEGD